MIFHQYSLIFGLIQYRRKYRVFDKLNVLRDIIMIYSKHNPDSKVHGAKMGPTWDLSAPDGPHVGPWTLLSGNGSWAGDPYCGPFFIQAMTATWHWYAWAFGHAPFQGRYSRTSFSTEKGSPCAIHLDLTSYCAFPKTNITGTHLPAWSVHHDKDRTTTDCRLFADTLILVSD